MEFWPTLLKQKIKLVLNTVHVIELTEKGNQIISCGVNECIPCKVSK